MTEVFYLTNIAGNAINISLPNVPVWTDRTLAPGETSKLELSRTQLKTVLPLLIQYRRMKIIRIARLGTRNSAIQTPNSSAKKRAGPATVSKIKILHLSDLHFSAHTKTKEVDDKESILSPKEKRGYSVFDNFVRHIKRSTNYNEFEKIFLVISGDLTASGDPTGLTDAKKFIEDCVEALKIPNDHVVLVPGNHDLTHAESSSDQIKNFKDISSEFCNPFSAKPYAEVKDQFLIYTLNSNKLKTSTTQKSFMGIKYGKKALKCIETPFVGQEQLNKVREHLKNSNHRVRFVTLHHHLVPVIGIETKKFDPILDAGECMNVLQEYGFSIALHGHKHKRSINYIQNVDVKSSSGLYVIGTESLGYESSFNEIDITIYDVGDPQIIFQNFKLNGTGAMPVGRLIDCSPKTIDSEQEQFVAVKAEIKLGSKND